MTTEQHCGMTFEQYVDFHCSFVALHSKEETTQADVIAFLKAWGQEPVFDKNDPEKLDSFYYMCAGLKPWEDVINAAPQLLAQKSMMYLANLSKDTHGDASESADMVEIEGVNLETFAKIAALMHTGHPDTQTLYAENGIRDQAHFDSVNIGYSAAMTTDTTGRLTAHYSELLMKHQSKYTEAFTNMLSNAMVQEQARIAAETKLYAEVAETIYAMSFKGDPAAIASYLMTAITDVDEEALDHNHLNSIADRLAEEKKWDALKVLLNARFLTLAPGGDQEEWVNDAYERIPKY